MIKNHETDSYLQAMEIMERGNLIHGLELLDEILSKDYEDTDILFEYDSLKNQKNPEEIDKNWIHKGTGIREIAGNILRLVSLGGSESIYEHEFGDVSGGIVVDFIMRRIGGGEENCQMLVNTNLGSELIRFNKNSIHISSTSSKVNVDFDKFHSFRLIMEKGVCALILDGKLVHSSCPSSYEKFNKITFGCTKGLSSADFESLWSLVRVGHGNNLLSKMIQKDLNYIFYNAKKFFQSGNIIASLKELSIALPLDPQHVEALQLLRSIIDQTKTRDRSVFSIDELIIRLNNPNLLHYWEKQKTNLKWKKIIEVDNVGVKFLTSMDSGTLAGLWNSFFSSSEEKYFWALRGVSCYVLEGETLGIIGRNGSGKSTLLRVISNILTPDEGYARIIGNAVLLSPGMGFREELSGRDNIYLGCLFMGLSRKEIDKQFDNIVDFAELRADINRSFKYYSDGMKSRLIFSVATHISHDILLLDEILSAGDISFNLKAAKRMEELVTNSKTAVIVTHATQFVRDHCTKALYLEKGRVKYFGDPDKAVDMYILDSKT